MIVLEFNDIDHVLSAYLAGLIDHATASALIEVYQRLLS